MLEMTGTASFESASANGFWTRGRKKLAIGLAAFLVSAGAAWAGCDLIQCMTYCASLNKSGACVNNLCTCT